MVETTIENRIAQLAPTYRSFIESDFIGEVATTFGQADGFDSRKVEVLENAITLHLLFFLNEAETITFIARHCNSTQADAAILFRGIMMSLPTEIVAAHARTQISTTTTPTKLASEIAETERELENLQGIRTMAGDMRHAQSHGAPTYKSTQSDLIRPSTPPPPLNSGPRWETDK